MALTQGVPRIKEIINASKEISTPVITCHLAIPDKVHAARIAKGRIEKTFLRDIIHYVRESWTDREGYITVKLNWDTIENLQLELTLGQIKEAIATHRRFKGSDLTVDVLRSHIKIRVDMDPSSKAGLSKTDIAATSADPYLRLKHLKRMLPDIQVLGHPQARRAIIHSERGLNKLLVEGYGLRACMNTDGIEGVRTKTNNVMEMRTVLGIEAARETIINEMGEVMKDMDIDPRHVSSKFTSIKTANKLTWDLDASPSRYHDYKRRSPGNHPFRHGQNARFSLAACIL